jgi:transcription initiation factor IIE alpha subunit
MQQLDFFNTTGESGDSLKQSIDRKDNQNETIMQIFQQYPDTLFTSWDICKLTPYLIGSVRRSLNTLRNAGLLVECEKKFNKDTNANVFTYKLG